VVGCVFVDLFNGFNRFSLFLYYIIGAGKFVEVTLYHPQLIDYKGFRDGDFLKKA